MVDTLDSKSNIARCTSSSLVVPTKNYYTKKNYQKKFTEKDTKHFFVIFDLDIYLVTLDIHYRLNFLGSFDLDTFYGEVSKS